MYMHQGPCRLCSKYGTIVNPQELEQLISASWVFPYSQSTSGQRRPGNASPRVPGNLHTWEICAQRSPGKTLMGTGVTQAGCSSSWTSKASAQQQTPWPPSSAAAPQPWGWFNTWHVGCSVHIPFGNPLIVFSITHRPTHMLTFSFREEWSFIHTMRTACEAAAKPLFSLPGLHSENMVLAWTWFIYHHGLYHSNHNASKCFPYLTRNYPA